MKSTQIPAILGKNENPEQFEEAGLDAAAALARSLVPDVDEGAAGVADQYQVRPRHSACPPEKASQRASTMDA